MFRCFEYLPPFLYQSMRHLFCKTLIFMIDSDSWKRLIGRRHWDPIQYLIRWSTLRSAERVALLFKKASICDSPDSIGKQTYKYYLDVWIKSIRNTTLISKNVNHIFLMMSYRQHSILHLVTFYNLYIWNKTATA